VHTAALKLAALVLCFSCLLCACTTTETADRTVHDTTNETEILSGAETTGEPEEKLSSFSLSYIPSYGFNPFTCECLTNRTAFSLLYEGLFTVSGSFEAEPVLCDTFRVSEDQKTYVFTLVQGVTFTDGTALTASDVVASLQAARNSSFYSGRLSHIDSISAADQSTVQITLDTPYENLPLVLDVPILKDGTQDAEDPVGTGPYALSGADAERSLVRYSGWWQDKAPVVDVAQVTLVAASSPTEIRDDFEFGTTDLVCTDPNSATSVGYHCNYEVWDCSTTILQYLGFNYYSAIFSSKTLRAAVTYAVDRSTIVTELMSGCAAAASLPCAPQSPFYDNKLAAGYAYDPSQFRAALADSGVTGTESSPGTFLVCAADPKRVSVAQYIADALQALGLYLTVESLDYDSYVSALQAGNYDLYYGEVKLPANFDLSCFYNSDGALCLGGIVDGEAETLCMSALANSGSYNDLFTMVMDDAAICPVLFKYYAVYMSRGKVDYLAPALDDVIHTAGGRTLSDANVSYDESSSGTEPTDASDLP
jgi:peptide/nickel transport system substrate-binding protein